MKKVLIVDDEMLVRVGLKTLIPWEEHNFSVIGEAQNGKEALQFFQETDIDIVITDISMPIMDGLELIKKIRQMKRGNEIEIIILTHYKDFEYARTAVNYNVSEYVLKSELNPDNLIKVLNNLNIDVSKNFGDKTVENKAKFNKLLKKMLNKKIISNKEYKEYLKSENFTDEYIDFYLFTGNVFFDNLSDMNSITKNGQIIQSVFEDCFNIEMSDTFVYSNGNEFVGIICTKKWVPEIEEIFERKIYQFKVNVYQLLDSKSLISKSTKMKNLINLLESFSNSLELKSHDYFDDLDEPEEIDINTEFSIDMNFLYKLLIKQAIDDILEYLNLVFHHLFTQRDITFAYKTLFNINLLLKENLNDENDKDLDVLFSEYDNFIDHKKILENRLRVYYKSDIKEASTSYIVNKAIDFIKQNYTKDITLTEIADYLDVSSGYLSFLFKKEVKLNLKSYINKIRIENAKKILIQSNERVYHIAQEVGFNNSHYFSKIFKEITGLTCSEYRNIYSKTASS